MESFRARIEAGHHSLQQHLAPPMLSQSFSIGVTHCCTLQACVLLGMAFVAHTFVGLLNILSQFDWRPPFTCNIVTLSIPKVYCNYYRVCLLKFFSMSLTDAPSKSLYSVAWPVWHKPLPFSCVALTFALLLCYTDLHWPYSCAASTFGLLLCGIDFLLDSCAALHLCLTPVWQGPLPYSCVAPTSPLILLHDFLTWTPEEVMMVHSARGASVDGCAPWLLRGFGNSSLPCQMRSMT